MRSALRFLRVSPRMGGPRLFGVVSDYAAKTALNSMVDHISSPRESPPASAASESSELRPDIEYDALTWKSIVDRPVVDSADNISCDDLYPRSAPSLDKDVVDESTDALDFRAFPGAMSVDPFLLVAPDLRGINVSIKALLGVDHPVLSTVAKYFFDFDSGKKVRPALVLLMAHAVNAHMSRDAGTRYISGGNFTASGAEIRAAQELLTKGSPVIADEGERSPLPAQVVLPLQRRLAEITELIHTASLLHDDVIDKAELRRGVGSVNAVFGNKLAVLAGDFLLARASVCLARLRSVPAVELLSMVIEHLVKGEVMQMHVALRSSKEASRVAFEMYMRKTYYKTGSLIANSCKAVATLGRYPDAVCNAAYKYGLHLGIAFQLVDDLLDFDGTTASLGKPALNDITQGLATAPVLFAAHHMPSLVPLIQRKFEMPGDVEAALVGIKATGGMALTRRLAIAHGQLALDAIAILEDSPARTALASLVSRVLSRTA